jgi:dipeptidyl aminopeptidase/acylaminoacyl peptidase
MRRIDPEGVELSNEWGAEMRVSFSGLLLLLASALLGCQSRENAPVVAEPTATPISTTNKAPSASTQSTESAYTAARGKFQTKLLHKGPCPEPLTARRFDKLDRPKGVQEIEYRSGDLRLKAWAQLPTEMRDRKLAAVVFLHGGWGFDEGDWEDTQPFRDAGFIVLAPMLRGENGCPGDFTMFYDEVHDAIAAGEHLAGIPGVDPQRVYLAGYSAGGTLAMLASMTNTRFRAVAALDGSPNRRSFAVAFKDVVPFDMLDEEEMRMRSAVDFPTSFRGPVRLYCSTDNNPYIPETRQIAKAAKSKGLDVEVVMVRGDHGSFRLPASKQAAEFFLKQK